MRLHQWVNRTLLKTLQVLLVSLACFATLSAQQALLNKEQAIIRSLQSHYGESAALRGKAWLALLANAPKEPITKQLFQVNKFFNQITFIDDDVLWGKSNYWATPIEFIGANGGDCEDYAIAKYFSLRELGVPDEKLRITMVHAKTLNQYHMVLTYYEQPSSMPLVLDNLIGEIKPANLRTDLLPIYSFNASQLWSNKAKGQGKLSGSSSRIKQWRNLRARMAETTLKQPKINLNTDSGVTN